MHSNESYKKFYSLGRLHHNCVHKLGKKVYITLGCAQLPCYAQHVHKLSSLAALSLYKHFHSVRRGREIFYYYFFFLSRLEVYYGQLFPIRIL